MTRLPTRRLLAVALIAAIAAPALAQSPMSAASNDPANPLAGVVEPTVKKKDKEASATEIADAAAPAATPAVVLAPAAADDFKVGDIRIDGLQRIGAGTVFTYLPIERGDTIDQARIAEAVRALYKTGFFEDVRIDRQGDILVVGLTERPAINKLTLVGNKDIKTEDLTKGLTDIGLSEGETFDRLSLDRVTQELTRQYNNRGKYNVEITPSVARLDRNRVDVTITIKEGKAAKIRHVNLIGNEVYEEKDITKGWESKESNWLSWYKRDDQYSREKLSGDLEKLNNFYLDRGYVDASVDSTQVAISPDKRDMFITAGITEGAQYTVSAVEVTGDTILPKDQIEKFVLVKPEQIFNRRLLEVTSDTITATLGNIGYAFAKVNPIPDVDREKRTVAVNLQVIPGPRVSVRRITYKGNTRTGDEVIRREMRQFEGAWFSQAAVDRSKVRLQRLGYFETVEVEIKPVAGSDDQVDVVFTVKETTSGSFVFGLGYSQLSGITTSIQLSQNNFLGSGNRIAVEAQRNSYLQRYAFSFVNPYFTDEGLSLGYNLSWREFDNSNFNTAQYSSTNAAATIVLGLPITESDTVTVAFGIDRNEIFAYEYSAPQEFVDYINVIGQRTFHSWRTELSWARDTRNDFFAPTRGTFQRVAAEITLPGSTVEYYKLNYEFSRYWVLNRFLVLNTRAELGYGDSYGKSITGIVYDPDSPLDSDNLQQTREFTATGLPFFENFYAGGVRSVRGFTDNTLGPCGYPRGSFDCQPIGGAVKTVGSLEMYFPTLLDTPSARVSVFVDVGNVFAAKGDFNASDLRASTGVALLWRAPVGPISISYAYPFRTQEGDELERLQFTFGGAF